MEDHELLAIAQQAARIEAASLCDVANQLTDTTVAIARRIIALAGKVIITGAGTSSFVARRMAHLLSVSGSPALFMHSMDALHGTMGALQATDLLIMFSKSGESDELVRLCQAAQHKGVTVVAVTENTHSSLGQVADIVVTLHTADQADPGNVLGMGSTLTASLWGDCVARAVMAERGWNICDSIDMHPAGGVGKRADELRKELS
ncbi:SIS domain-containing protein [Trueperella sp. LYQ141]|uniref:SIS domain-containing protein n=1 Tax=Trueperella sp. LYQ141 TaxID=3391058 RepID=UPI0039839747